MHKLHVKLVESYATVGGKLKKEGSTQRPVLLRVSEPLDTLSLPTAVDSVTRR